MGKQVHVQVLDHDLRLPDERLRPFFATLVHPLRNALDHGVESPEARQAQGKPETGQIRIETRCDEQTFQIIISDDGAGIRWEALRERARAQGLPHEDRAELIEAMLTDGVSTSAQVTPLSGRGVGLASTAAMCRRLQGRVEIESSPGQGTTQRFIFPRHAWAS